MSGGRGLGAGPGAATEAWLRLLLRLYPEDFRDEVGADWLDAYRERARAASSAGAGADALAVLWARALVDSLRNGVGERVRPAVTWRRRGSWGLDAQRAVRRLVRAPGFTLATVATLTVGLGAFAVVWSAVDNVLLEPPAYEAPEDLYFVWRDYTWLGLERGWLGGPDVVALAAAGSPIAAAVAVRLEAKTLESGAGGRPEELTVMETTPGLFELLGVAPALGRGFGPEEHGPGRSGVAVLGHELWATRFARDPAVLGRTLRLNGEAFTVVGVAPAAFRFARHSSLGMPRTADLYTTFDYDLASEPPVAGSFAGLIRAQPGAQPEAVKAAVGAVGVALDREHFDGLGLALRPVGLVEDLVAPVRPALLVLGFAGAFLLLVLAVNLATLLLGRAADREREMAVARALGADRWVLARATLLEGGLLGLLAGAGALLFAVWGTRLLVEAAPPDLPRRLEIGVDASVAVVVLGAALLLGLLAGAVPAAWSSRSPLVGALREASVRGGAGRGRLRRSMVVVQVALSLVLLTAGGLLTRSLDHLLRADPGFVAAGALALRVPLSGAAYEDDAAVVAFQDRLLAELRALPGVRAAGAVSALPLAADASQAQVSFPGAPGNTGDPDRDQPMIDYYRATGDALAALGVRVLEGRPLDDAAPASDGEPWEVLIDRALADRFFPGGSALGAELTARGATMRVVGVVGHARLYDVHRDGRGQLWLRNRDLTRSSLHYVLRTDGRPIALAAPAAAVVRRLDPSLPVSDLRTLESIVEESLSERRLSVGLVGSFALGALLLATMGIYAVVAGAVARRRKELSIRMALGAEPGNVLRMVLRDGIGLVGLGLLLGLPGVWLAGRVLRGVLVGTSPFDLLTLATVAAGLVLVTVIATWIPARRAAWIDPARSLRAD